jgi:hypothetical protein
VAPWIPANAKVHAESVPEPPTFVTLTVIELFVVRAVISPSMKLVADPVLMTRTRLPTTKAPVFATENAFDPVPIATLDDDVELA